METEYPTKNDLVILKRVRWSPVILTILGALCWGAGELLGVALGEGPDDIPWIAMTLKSLALGAWSTMPLCFVWTIWHLARQLEKSADAGKHLREVIDGD